MRTRQQRFREPVRQHIPAAVEYLTVVSSAPSVSPPEVMADVKDGRTGIIYKVTVPGHENLD